MTLASELSAACNAPVDVYLTENARGAVVICPGGGYGFCSPREGAPVARAFNRIGLDAFVLWYDCQHPPLAEKPLKTLSKTVQAVRGRAETLGIRTDRIAVCGFSAGAHLACSLGALWNNADRFPATNDLQAHRPDAMILGYPVVTAGEFAHRRSLEQLAGMNQAAQRTWSLEQLVGAHTPPAFIWHTADDREVPCQNSLLLVNALVQNDIMCEFHLYPRGVHGLSLATPEVDETDKGRVSDPHVAGWFAQLAEWLDILWPSETNKGDKS